jgi:putative nucleotidyltransferase with HDIG domain
MSDLIAFITQLATMRDPYSGTHGDHVAVMSVALARELGLPSSQIELLEQAATIHDIGKFSISEYVVNKPGRLTEAEYIMIQQHTVLGQKILKPLDLDPIIGQTILCHHENYDGSGYPNKVSGDEIPLEARIIRITDTYDALTSKRSYRDAHTPRKALQVMESEAQCFDPLLMKAFIKNISNGH